jgi:hypothetical protein
MSWKTEASKVGGEYERVPKLCCVGTKFLCIKNSFLFLWTNSINKWIYGRIEKKWNNQYKKKRLCKKVV